MWDNPFQIQTKNHCVLGEAEIKKEINQESNKSSQKENELNVMLLCTQSPLYEKHPQCQVGGKCQDPKEVGEGICPDLQILECMASQLVLAAVRQAWDVPPNEHVPRQMIDRSKGEQIKEIIPTTLDTKVINNRSEFRMNIHSIDKGPRLERNH